MPVGMSEGLRVAVIGAGPSGSAFASSLLAAARAFGRRLEVVLYDGEREAALRPPALLSADLRGRLASLGAALPLRPAPVEVRGVLVHGGGRSTLIEPPPGGLYILDSPSVPGQRIVKQSLVRAATLRGAKLRQAVVQTVELRDGEYVVRAHGGADGFGMVVGAFGVDSELAPRWLGGRFTPPRRMLGTQARLSWPGRDDLLRICLAPTPEVDALVLIPCGASAWALGIGAQVEPASLASALAVLARDRALPGGVRILAAAPAPLAAGAARRLAAKAAVTIGSAAFGNLLDPGLLPALVSATRTASVSLELGEHGPLRRRLSDSEFDLSLHARRQARILRLARQAGARAPAAFSRLASGRTGAGGFHLLGLDCLQSDRVLSGLRWQSFKEGLVRAFGPPPAPPRAEATAGSLVYVVDDDPDTRALIGEFLQTRGAIVRSFDDELALLEAAARERPAAIVLDVVLRWVDGFSLCRQLRAHPATRASRLITMSSLGRRSDREAAVAAGADAFLGKPVDLDELGRLLTGIPAQPPKSGSLAEARQG